MSNSQERTYYKCKAVGCNQMFAATKTTDFCDECVCNLLPAKNKEDSLKTNQMSTLYPQYYKSVEHLDEIDVYAVHHLFNIQDPSGAIQHASKKLLLSGVRTGGKSQLKDIKEARDTLTRWLQINSETP